jgi:hypothetical protein
MRSALKAFLALSLATSLAACSSDGNGGSTTLTVNLTGTASYFPVAEAVLAGAGAPLPAFDPTKWQIEVLDPLKVVLGVGTAASRVCNPAVALSLTGATGAWTCNGIDAKAITLGIVGNMVDNNATKLQTVTTSTGLKSPFCVDVPCTGVTQGQTFTAAPGFIIPDAFATILAQLIHGAGSDYADLANSGKGYILVWVLDTTVATPVGIAGATLSGVPGTHTVSYPNSTFTGLGASTGATGVAIVEVSATGATPIVLSASAAGLPACGGGVTTNCIASQPAGIANGFAFVQVLEKN